MPRTAKSISMPLLWPPVVPRSVLTAFSSVFGDDTFRFGRRSAERHGAALVSWAQVDHVVPWSRGGPTDETNLVTSCWACNFGKDSYELAQIGIADPRLCNGSGNRLPHAF